MPASKSIINDKKNNSLIECDHKADIQRLEAEDKRITEAESKHWEQLFKKFVNWGPEKFNIITEMKKNYSLFPFLAIHQASVDERLSGTWSLTSDESVLLINDLENLLAKWSQYYIEANKKAKAINKIVYKSQMALDKLLKDFDVHFQKIFEIDAICYEIYVLTETIHKTTCEMLSMSKQLDELALPEVQQQNLGVVLDQLYPEHLEKTQLAIQKCNDGLKLLDKCEFVLNEVVAMQTVEHNCKRDDKPVWSKMSEVENRRLFTHTGAIPKAYRSKLFKRKKNSKATKKSKIVDEPPTEMLLNEEIDLIQQKK